MIRWIVTPPIVLVARAAGLFRRAQRRAALGDIFLSTTAGSPNKTFRSPKARMISARSAISHSPNGRASRHHDDASRQSLDRRLLLHLLHRKLPATVRVDGPPANANLAGRPDVSLGQPDRRSDPRHHRRPQRYADTYNADADRWLFLTGSESEVRHFVRDTLKFGIEKNHGRRTPAAGCCTARSSR